MSSHRHPSHPSSPPMPSGVRVSQSASFLSTGGGGTSDGSPPHGISVSLGATFDYNGTPIPVNSGDVTQLRNSSFQFELTQPVDLGSIDDFLHWLHTELGLPDLSGEVQDLIDKLKSSAIGIIQQLGILLDDIYNATISITVLVINITPTTKIIKLGVTMTLKNPFEIIHGLNLDALGVTVGYTG